MDRYTSGAYAADNPDWHEADASGKAAALAAAVRSLGWRPRTVADVGCGSGGVLACLAEELLPDLPGATFEGWDPAPEAIRRARERERPGLRFVEGDFLAGEGRVDLALLVDVVEHVADDLAFLRAVAARADCLLLRLPLDLSALDLLRPGRLLDARRRFGHLRAWSRELALATLEEAGLQVLLERYHGPHPAPGLLQPLRRLGGRIAPHATARALGGFSLIVGARPR